MDCPEVRAGNTVYLGVRVPGALVSFGDGHFAMGEGEIIGTAIEGAMNVASPNPLPNADFMRLLREACGASFGLPASKWMLELGAVFMREMDAYQFVSQNARAPIVEIVDPNYTVLVKIPKNRLPVAR